MAARKRRKARIGRPPSPPDELRRHRVVVTLTEREFAQLFDLAEAENLPPGSKARQFVVAALARQR